MVWDGTKVPTDDFLSADWNNMVTDQKGRSKVYTGTATPVGAVTPEAIGDLYIKTDTSDAYVATGATSADWELIDSSTGGIVWGAITGTLSNQIDLQAVLDAKAASLTSDENYVTDAELVVIGNTSGANTGDQSAGDFAHDSLSTITGTAGQYNHPTDANMTVIGNTSNTNSGDQSAGDFAHDSLASITGTVGQYNHPTDSAMTILGNTSGTNSGDNAVNSNYSGLVTNANHSGDATGSTALTLATVNANVGSFTSANITVNAKGLITAAANGSAGYTNLTQFVDQTAWRVFYSDTDGDITELALGADGTYLKSNGVTSAPTFATPSGSGDVSKVGNPVDNQVGVWTGDGTIEGDAGLTYDGETLDSSNATDNEALTLASTGNTGTYVLSTVGDANGHGVAKFATSSAFIYSILANNIASALGRNYFYSGGTANSSLPTVRIDNSGTTYSSALQVNNNGTSSGGTPVPGVLVTQSGTAPAMKVTSNSTDSTDYVLHLVGSAGAVGLKIEETGAVNAIETTGDIDITGDILVSGSLGATGSRSVKGWFTDLEVTNSIVASITGTAVVATTVTITDNESTNEENVIAFVADAVGSGNVGLEADGNMTYNPSTGKITATGFIGALTGNADTVTNFTPASGSLTLAGADSVTITTTASTSVTLPTSGTLIANVVEDTTPQIGGDLDLNNKALTRIETAGESLVDGNLCYLKSDGKYWKADASVDTTCKQDLLMANATISADATGKFVEFGEWTSSSLTAGSIYYVSETGGAITTTAPTTSTSIVRIVGTAISTTVLKFKPDVSYVEVA